MDFLTIAVAAIVALLTGALLFLPRGQGHWQRSHLAQMARRHRWPLLLGFAILGINAVETHFDPAITEALGWDFTTPFARFDGSLHSDIQGALQSGLGQGFAFLLAAVYVLGLPFALYFTPFYFAWLDAGLLLRRTILAIGLCYTVAMPFYLLFPVDEVWSWHDAPGPMHVENLVIEALPFFGPALYSVSASNNNFPSLHTALSLVLAAQAWDSKHRAYAWFMVAIAALTVVSTVVLGIHWTLDVVAGLALAAAVTVAARRILPAPS
jgi:membrane-associated phospholipid phosphatase